MVIKKSVIFVLLLSIVGLNINFVLYASTPVAPKTPANHLFHSSLLKFQYKQKTLNFAIAEFESESAKPGFAENSHLNFQQGAKPKTRGKAFLRSLILPGWGQYYAESKTMMKVFIISEVLAWGAYFGYTSWSNWLEDDYRTFAVTHANVKLANKTDRYFVDIGNYNDIYEYNQAKLQDRDVPSLYPANEEFHWQWDNEENRRKFDRIRISSDRASNRAEFAVAAIFLNHFVSAIHSILAVHKYNKRLAKQGLGVRIDLQGYSENRYLIVGFIKKF